MPNANVQQEICEKCGVDVRENTAFCYNCGSPVAGDPVAETVPEANGTATSQDPDTQAALDDLARRFKIEEVEDGGKLAKAAAERKKARIKQREPAEFVWEPVEDSSIRFVALLAVLITVIAAAAVFLTIVWR